MSNNISGNNVNPSYSLNFQGKAKKTEKQTEAKPCDCPECEGNINGLDAQGAYAKGAMKVDFKGAYKANSNNVKNDVLSFQDTYNNMYFNALNELSKR